MLLTVSTTHRPATDLGFLLGRNTERCQSFPLPFGQAHVFYPTAGIDRCTAALLLEFDTVRFVRDSRNRTNDPGTLSGYVNDRPYVASSLMSIAMARAFAPAMSGESRDRPKLVDTPIDLEATLSVVRCREGEGLLKRIFEPLGYTVTVTPIPLEAGFAAWGESPYHSVKIAARTKLKDLVSQLYLLLPVLDDDVNYEIGDEKLVKLIERREGWLRTHPERERIAKRYVKSEHRWVEPTLARIVAEDTDDLAFDDDEREREERARDVPPDIEKLRIAAVMGALREASARRVADFACGTGTLLKALLPEPRFKQIVGIDASLRALEIAKNRLAIDKLSPESRDRISLHQGSPAYRDARIAGFDAVCLLDYLDRIPRSKLPALERVVFEFAKPVTAIFTADNADHPTHRDAPPRPHGTAWSKTAFDEWATEVASRFGYELKLVPVGPKHETHGSPSQMAVWTR